jgi:hypothetical protein
MDVQVLSELAGPGAMIVMVHSAAWDSTLPVWDELAALEDGCTMRRVHYDDVPLLCLSHGVHYFPSFICNRGERVRVGYHNAQDLAAMIEDVKSSV